MVWSTRERRRASSRGVSLKLYRSLITRIRHSLNLCGTTGVHSDAIYGSFTTTAYCLLKKQEGAGNPRVFGRSKITFMVTKPDVRLDKIILGIPWQKSVKMFLKMDEEVDRASCRLYSEGSIRRCNLQLKQNGKIWMTTNEKVDKADTSAIFGINSVFLEENVSLKLNEQDGIILPEYINLKNNYQISQDREFPIILGCSEIKLPIKVNTSSKNRIRILLTVIDPETAPQDSNIPAPGLMSCPLLQSENLPENVHSLSGNVANPANISFGCIQDVVNCLSLPPEERDFLLQGSRITTRHSPPPPVQISTSMVSKDELCSICHVFSSRCSCRRQCNVCLMWVELGGPCQCDMLNLTALKARITTDSLDESDVVLENEQTNISEIIDEKFEMFSLAPPL